MRSGLVTLVILFVALVNGAEHTADQATTHTPITQAAVTNLGVHDPADYMDSANLPAGVPVWHMQYDEVSDAMWDGLLDMGYRGDPNADNDTLYIPVEVALVNCATDSDCAKAEDAGVQSGLIEYADGYEDTARPVAAPTVYIAGDIII